MKGFMTRPHFQSEALELGNVQGEEGMFLLVDNSSTVI